MIRFLRYPLLAGLLIITLAGGGCALRQYGGPSYSATAEMKIDPALPPAQARRDTIQLALVRARDQILNQVIKLRLNDGRTLEELAIADPYIQAKLQDTVRAARIEDRTISDDGVVKVTVTMELKPVYDMIDEYGAVVNR